MRCQLFVFIPVIILLLRVSAGVSRANPATLPGIKHEYRLDEGMGTSAVDSIGGNNAVLSNFGAVNAQWIPGTFGSGVNYTDENAYMLTDSPISVGSASQFSVSFWSRLNSKPNSNDSILLTPQSDNWITYNPTGNTNSLGKRGIGVGSVRDPNEPQLGIWEHYVITYDRPLNFVSVYRDGLLRDVGEVTLPSLSTRWVFGHNQGLDNTNGSWHGALDEIQIYDRMLTLSEVQVLASVPYPQGDYNRSGEVDTADYVLWRDQVGQNVSACSGADANCNTLVENIEYQPWRRNFGRTSITFGASSHIERTTNVPEPTSLLCMLVFAVIVSSNIRTRLE
jgi:hypothetical protein